MITINDKYIGAITQILTLVFGGGLVGNLIAGKNNKKVNEQTFINQLQEERNYTNVQLKERDEKIEELYKLYYSSEERIRVLLSEKTALEWTIKRKEEEIVLLKLEIVKLKGGD